jgi:hypothetical protein
VKISRIEARRKNYFMDLRGFMKKGRLASPLLKKSLRTVLTALTGEIN